MVTYFILYFVVSNAMSNVRLSEYVPAYSGVSVNLIKYFFALSKPVAVSSDTTELSARTQE